MKIVMACEFYNSTLAFQENLLVKYYRKMGHEVSVITSTYLDVFDYYHGKHDNAQPAQIETDLGARIIRLPFRYNFLNKIKAYRGFAKALNDEKPDFIFVHDIMPDFPAMVAYVESHPSVKMIMDYHADYSNSGKNQLSIKLLHGVIRKYFLDQARPHLARILPIVPAGFPFLHEVYGVPMSEMELLPLGADTDAINEVRVTKPRQRIREHYAIPENAFVIVTGGKLERAKQTELLLDAVKSTGRDDIHVVICGKFGPEKAYEETVRAAASKLEGRVHFAGWLDSQAMYAHMLASDIAVFPASQTVLWQQSIACGLPLLVGDTGWQSPQYMNKHDNIIILSGEQLSQTGFRDEILSLVTDVKRRKAMADGARKTTDTLLDWDVLARQTLVFSGKYEPTT
jgi:1,2-diacylglycerol 3-alpha-glucosyltransferase